MAISADHNRIDKESTERRNWLEKAHENLNGMPFLLYRALVLLIKFAVLQSLRVSSMPYARPRRVHPACLPPGNTQRTSTSSVPREYPSPMP